MSLGPVVVCKPFSQPYHDALKSKGFDPHFVQVLDTGFVNERELQSVIEAGPKGKWSGVIVTSSRAAGAWISAAKAIPVDTESSFSQDGGDVWEDIPFYVVGKATEEALMACPPPYSPRQILGGNSGSGDTLADFIVSSYVPKVGENLGGSTSSSNDSQGLHLPLLYLVGDKNRDTIPKKLSQAILRCHKLQVYETSPVADLSNRLKDVTSTINETTSGEETTRPWLVLFSPSTAEAVFGALSECQPSTSEHEEMNDTSNIYSSFHLASIGPTTHKYLCDNSHLVATSAPKPDAESLAQAIFDKVVRDE
ncbi:hypothetical protein FRB91_002086 [Serendipita sp. 411]|nr:hypothetical protein FRB91_002086 [Serendipita sp. 411]